MKLSIELNSLYQVHTLIVNIPVAFRDQMCKDNNWSYPTYYRKMKKKKHGVKSLMPELTGAENYSTIRQAISIYNQLGTLIEEISLSSGFDFQKVIIKVEPTRSGKRSSKATSVNQSTAKPMEPPPYQFGSSLNANDLSMNQTSENNIDPDEGE